MYIQYDYNLEVKTFVDVNLQPWQWQSFLTKYKVFKMAIGIEIGRLLMLKNYKFSVVYLVCVSFIQHVQCVQDS